MTSELRLITIIIHVKSVSDSDDYFVIDAIEDDKFTFSVTLTDKTSHICSDLQQNARIHDVCKSCYSVKIYSLNVTYSSTTDAAAAAAFIFS